MARKSNKSLLKDVVAFIKWLRASCKKLLRWEPPAHQTAASPRKQAEKKPGHLAGKPPRNEETKIPPRKRTCLKCDSERHRVKDCPRVNEEHLRRWREKKSGKTTPQTSTGAKKPVRSVNALHFGDVSPEGRSECMAVVENMLDLHDVLLDSGADVNVASRGLVHQQLRCGAVVKEESYSPHQLAIFDGSCFQVTKRITFGIVQLRTTAGPLLLRIIQAWVFEEEKKKSMLVLSRPVMEHAILARACDIRTEWDLQDLGGEGVGSVNLIYDNSLLVAMPELGREEPDQVAAILEDRIAEAVSAGLSATDAERLRSLLTGVSQCI
ncbi:Hypothetical protein PHPALM_6904 [Phytophthora palmivora]|uniref:Peptidase A2 domain-containing protein n=1 Tax=Phytophthora palmivora TaxID=4796 RepID=A0A2P4YDN8_9STRA|nr:Hypothetical protein PHPALM_6904 [Phytophthora palmivora]